VEGGWGDEEGLGGGEEGIIVDGEYISEGRDFGNLQRMRITELLYRNRIIIKLIGAMDYEAAKININIFPRAAHFTAVGRWRSHQQVPER
jgi:hypothetical protein